MTSQNQRRRGYALIEVLVVVTIVVVMLGLCAGMIHLLLQLDRGGRMSSEQAADLSRLADDFRADAHAAAPIDPLGQPQPTIRLAIGDGKSVEYLVRPADIVRTLREGEKVRHYDLYRRPPRSNVSFELTREGATIFASLIVDRQPNGLDDSLYRDFRIEAELGRDRHLMGRAE